MNAKEMLDQYPWAASPENIQTHFQQEFMNSLPKIASDRVIDFPTHYTNDSSVSDLYFSLRSELEEHCEEFIYKNFTDIHYLIDGISILTDLSASHPFRVYPYQSIWTQSSQEPSTEINALYALFKDVMVKTLDIFGGFQCPCFESNTHNILIQKKPLCCYFSSDETVGKLCFDGYELDSEVECPFCHQKFVASLDRFFVTMEPTTEYTSYLFKKIEKIYVEESMKRQGKDLSDVVQVMKFNPNSDGSFAFSAPFCASSLERAVQWIRSEGCKYSRADDVWMVVFKKIDIEESSTTFMIFDQNGYAVKRKDQNSIR